MKRSNLPQTPHAMAYRGSIAKALMHTAAAGPAPFSPQLTSEQLPRMAPPAVPLIGGRIPSTPVGGTPPGPAPSTERCLQAAHPAAAAPSAVFHAPCSSPKCTEFWVHQLQIVAMPSRVPARQAAEGPSVAGPPGCSGVLHLPYPSVRTLPQCGPCSSQLCTQFWVHQMQLWVMPPRAPAAQAVAAASPRVPGPQLEVPARRAVTATAAAAAVAATAPDSEEIQQSEEVHRRVRARRSGGQTVCTPNEAEEPAAEPPPKKARPTPR